MRHVLADVAFHLLKSQATVRSMFRNLKMGLYTIDSDGNFLDASEEFLEIVGVSSLKELQESNARQVLNISPLDRTSTVPRLECMVRQVDLDRLRTDGRLMTILDVSYGSKDDGAGILIYSGFIIDITDRKHLESQLTEPQSFRDPLTGAYNKFFLEEFEKKMVESDNHWGCIYIFIDHFKQFNDRYGFEAGEEVLKKMSRFLMRHARANDGVVRMSDDEFLVLVPNVDPPIISRIHRRFRQAALAQAPITFSMGAANRCKDEGLETTILRASRDLYPVRVLLRPQKPVRR